MTILITCTITSVLWYALDAIHWIGVGRDRLWFISSITAPGRMALEEIDADLTSGKYELAKLKIEALQAQWKLWITSNSETAQELET